MASGRERPQRLVFGEVAELYDRRRPDYPPSLVEEVIGLAHIRRGERAIEVGPGTGKATRQFAQRGIAVLGIEPSATMLAVARRNCAAYPRVEFVEADFERWDASGETFPLLYAAQAWHWIDPERRYSLARAALRSGGVLAVFWNRPAWAGADLRDAVSAAYERVVPDLDPSDPMHPMNPGPLGLRPDPGDSPISSSEPANEWTAEIAAVPGFADPGVRLYRWRQDYSAEAYAGMLATHSSIRLLDDHDRERLLDAVRDAIDAHGGTLRLPMVTWLHLARAV